MSGGRPSAFGERGNALDGADRAGPDSLLRFLFDTKGRFAIGRGVRRLRRKPAGPRCDAATLGRSARMQGHTFTTLHASQARTGPHGSSDGTWPARASWQVGSRSAPNNNTVPEQARQMVTVLGAEVRTPG